MQKARIRMEKERKTAVALSYQPNDTAPKIIASGKGILADKIIAKASKEEIPIHKDAPLANTLSKLELGDCIPPELYEVVAQVLLFVDRMDLIQGRVMGEAQGEQKGGRSYEGTGSGNLFERTRLPNPVKELPLSSR